MSDVTAARSKFGSLGGGGEKCKTCTKTVYPQEKMAYDQGVWHISCFKCLKCNSTLTVAAVAMIGGDLYCKVCFKKIFLKEGRYSSFSQVPGSQSLAQAAKQSANTADITAISEGTADLSVNQSKDSSAAQSRSVSGATTPREETKDEAPSTTQSVKPSVKQSTPDISQPVPLADRTPLQRLVYAIEMRDDASINECINQSGVGILFTPYQTRRTIIEWCLAKSIYQSIGQSMLDRLKTELEAKQA